MVETGEWTVRPDGVEGGIDVVKNADTKEHAAAYDLDVCFDV